MVFLLEFFVDQDQLDLAQATCSWACQMSRILVARCAATLKLIQGANIFAATSVRLQQSALSVLLEDLGDPRSLRNP